MAQGEAPTPFDAEHAQSALIVASSHDAIVGTNAAGVITSCNPAAGRMFGRLATEVIGQPVETFISPECREMEAAILRRIGGGGAEVAQYRTERVCRDGSVTAVSASCSPIVDDTGAIVGAATVSRKVSDLQQGGRPVRGPGRPGTVRGQRRGRPVRAAGRRGT